MNKARFTAQIGEEKKEPQPIPHSECAPTMTASTAKYYSVDIQVDFDAPREVSPAVWTGKRFPAVGYFQYFYCTERSKQRAKAIALEFVRNHEEYPDRCRIKCDRIAWMNLVRRREDLAIGALVGLTDEMFAAKDRIGGLVAQRAGLLRQ